MGRARMAGVVAGLILAWASVVVAQNTAWIHVSVETRGTSGEQTSTFRAFTTSDEAGTQLGIDLAYDLDSIATVPGGVA